MVTVNADRLVNDYLRQLEAAAAGLAPDDRTELVAEVREHISSALVTADGRDEVAVRNVLERLGPPEEIAGAAAPVVPEAPADRPVDGRDIAGFVVLTAGFLVPFLGLFMRSVALGPWEVASLAAWGFAIFLLAWRLFTRAGPRGRGGGLELAAIVLLTVGGFIWTGFSWLAGYALVWLSDAWTTRDKLTVLLVAAVLLPVGWSLTTPAHGIDAQLQQSLLFASGVGGLLSGTYLAWRLVRPAPGSVASTRARRGRRA
jgi:HAAS domain-containing protein